MAHEETPKAINSDEPYYIVLFQSAEGQTPFSLTVPVHVTLSQYRDGKVTLPLGLDKGFVPVLPCLWYCLQLPRNRFDLVHAPLQGRKALQRLHLPQRIILVPVPLSFSSILRLNNSGPNLIFTSDDLLPVAQSLARELDHVVDVTPASALNVHLLQHHWRALYAALALDRPQYIQPAHLFECAPGKSAHLITQFLARHLRADADHHLPSPGIPQSEILRYALDHQAQLSTIAKLEALRTPPHEAEQIFPQMREEEMERFQCPVSVGVPGISPRVPSRWLEKKLRRFGMIDSTDAAVEGLMVEFLVAHRALARGGMGFVSQPVNNHAFALLYTLESMWKWGRPKPKAVWQYLNRITRVARQSFTDEELATLSHASSLTCFSEFPLGLMTLPYASSPLCCHIPIAYRPLMPLSRALLIELTPVPIVYLKERLRVLVAECLSADDPVGRLSRVGWRMATRRLSGITNIVCRVQEITSVAAFRSALREAEYDILVISAHGAVEPRQHRTGFWCGNELVVEEELGPLPKIVCFSSCQVSPRGYGSTNITDLMYRQGALVVLGTLVPIDVVQNAILMTRVFNNITEAQQGKMPENTFDAVWQLTASSNAVNDILGSNMSLLQDVIEAKGKRNIFEEFMLDRSRGRLRLNHIYQDTEAVLRDIAKDRGILDRFNAWMRSQGYLPESLFYVVLGYPERIVFYDATIEKSLR